MSAQQLVVVGVSTGVSVDWVWVGEWVKVKVVVHRCGVGGDVGVNTGVCARVGGCNLPKAPPISAPLVGMLTFTIPQSEPKGLCRQINGSQKHQLHQQICPLRNISKQTRDNDKEMILEPHYSK